MSRNMKISVAIATYNGEKFIRDQIVSICEQTVKPDEIIVSDDGSRDKTLGIVYELSQKYSPEGINIKILQDNPRKGYCGNFEWAITHTSGDYIFVSDQDDVWKVNKIERVLNAFVLHPEAECIIHEAEFIDENGKKLSGIFNEWAKKILIDKGVKSDYQLKRDEFLAQSVSGTLARGMVLCLSRKSLEQSIPFPECDGSHDAWLIFSAILNDKCWFIPDILAEYRLHGNNACGSSEYKGSRRDKIKRTYNRLKVQGIRASLNNLYLGRSMMNSIEKKNYTSSLAYQVAIRVCEIGEKEVCAVTSGRFSGAKQLFNLYRNDIRYRNIGKASFICQLCRIILYSKRKRQRIMQK